MVLIIIIIIVYKTYLIVCSTTSALYCFNPVNASLFFYNIFLMYSTTILPNMDSFSYIMVILSSFFKKNPIPDASFLHFFLVPIVNLFQRSALPLCLLNDVPFLLF